LVLKSGALFGSQPFNSAQDKLTAGSRQQKDSLSAELLLLAAS